MWIELDVGVLRVHLGDDVLPELEGLEHVALSTLVTRLLRWRAAWNATWAMRSISGRE
jgi:hypothetical protein